LKRFIPNLTTHLSSALSLRRAYGFVLALATVVGIGSILKAGLSPENVTTFVEIDGGVYGTFEKVKTLTDITSNKSSDDEGFVRVTLTRDFVTDPSLYLWAKQNHQARGGLQDIHLVMRTDEGTEVGRYVLKMCQPLSWSLEAVNPALGGFHETVEIAVQEISVH
jgi:hypothetical protein